MNIGIELDRQSSIPLYIQIAEQIIKGINSGVLKAGERLPAERKLAALLGVNRSTVINAYSELESGGYVSPHVGRGTTVAIPADNGRKVETFHWHELLSGQGESLINPYNNAMSALLYRRDDFILMDSGIAAPGHYPAKQLADLCREVLLSEGESILQHNSPQGLKSLRESLASIMKMRDVNVPPEDIVILNGSQQGLDLIARVLLEPGDCVVIEQPCFLGAIDIFRAYGVKLIGIPTDGEGMVVERLEKILNRVRPKLIYTIPTFQNPTGVSMSMARRKRLLELANRYQVPVLEDDPYGLLNYGTPPLPPLKSMDTTGIVVYLSTVSKILCPGLRLGWMAAPPDLVRLIVAAKQVVDLHSNNLLQRVVDIFYRKGLLEKHLVGIRDHYMLKRDAMLNALECYAPEGMTWNRPAGGYYIWAALPEGLSSVRLLQEAVENKISFVAGPAFYTAEEGQGKIRLNYTYATPELINQGIKVLCELIRDLQIKAGGIRRPGTREVMPIV